MTVVILPEAKLEADCLADKKGMTEAVALASADGEKAKNGSSQINDTDFVIRERREFPDGDAALSKLLAESAIQQAEKSDVAPDEGEKLVAVQRMELALSEDNADGMTLEELAKFARFNYDHLPPPTKEYDSPDGKEWYVQYPDKSALVHLFKAYWYDPGYGILDVCGWEQDFDWMMGNMDMAMAANLTPTDIMRGATGDMMGNFGAGNRSQKAASKQLSYLQKTLSGKAKLQNN